MSKRLDSTPLKDNFHMPAEWETHSAIWMLWPQRPDNWRNGGKPAQHTFSAVAHAIAKHTKVIMGVNHDQYENARAMLNSDIKLLEISNDDSWIRDCGATIVKNPKTNEKRAVDWVFNAWGGLVDGLYFPWDKDELVAGKMAEFHDFNRYKLEDFVLEGGSIHSDGNGTIMTTEECLLSAGRNPQFTKEQIEEHLKTYLGAKKVIWLPYGIYNDETNGHVDNIANFAPNNKIVLAWTDDKKDPQYERSAKNYEVLKNATDANGKPYEIIKLHIPEPIYITAEESEEIDSVEGTKPREENDRQAASYANYLITNKAIILPIFNDSKWDKNAIEVLKKAYPGYEIETVYSREIILGGGNIHCITQQIPE